MTGQRIGHGGLPTPTWSVKEDDQATAVFEPLVEVAPTGLLKGRETGDRLENELLLLLREDHPAQIDGGTIQMRAFHQRGGFGLQPDKIIDHP